MEGNKKESVFKKIENNVLLQIAFFVVSMAVIVGAYVLISNKVQWNNEQKRISGLKVTEDYNILVGLDDVISDGKNIQLSGWALRLDSVTEKVHLVLKEMNGTEEIVLKTESSDREDVEEYFDSDWEFGQVGFETLLNEKMIKADACYEVFASLDYKIDGAETSRKIALGQYLYNGQLYRYNPKSFAAPLITDEDFTKAVEDGTLYYYDEQNDIWIYIYDNKQYLITGKELSLDERPSVPIRMYLVAADRALGEEQVTEGKEVYITKEHMVDDYYVIEIEMSRRPISYIHTGIYSNEGKQWLTDQRFQLGIQIQDK